MGWSQERLAFEAGIQRSFMSVIKRPVRNPTLDAVDKIATALSGHPLGLSKPPDTEET